MDRWAFCDEVVPSNDYGVEERMLFVLSIAAVQICECYTAGLPHFQCKWDIGTANTVTKNNIRQIDVYG